MTKMTTFQDLDCWQNARRLTVDIYRLDSPGLAKDWTAKDQFRRASLSVMNNIAEGFSRFSTKEKIRFYEIAQSSASEVESMLYLLEDLAYLSPQSAQTFREQVNTTRFQILALIRYHNNKLKASSKT